jgi:membrane protease YdiL (CAAX protease family)
MTSEPPMGSTFWTTVRLLLGAARKRAVGRRKRQHQLFSHRAGKKATNWAGLGDFIVALMMILLHVAAAFLIIGTVQGSERAEFLRRDVIVVDGWFVTRVSDAETMPSNRPTNSFRPLDLFDPLNPRPVGGERRAVAARAPNWDKGLDDSYAYEAKSLSKRFGGDPGELEKTLRDAAQKNGGMAFVDLDSAAPGLSALPRSGPVTAMLGSLALLLWSAMLICQGEGLELDMQRRRHPMWEWLFSHPTPIGAVFFAEMLAPVAANPAYYAAPLFPAILYGSVYGAAPGFAAAFVVGMPIMVAAACLGKALEIGIILRSSAHSRGAMIGLMSWFGFASMLLIFMASPQARLIAAPPAIHLAPLAAIDWPWLGLFLGQRPDGSFSFLAGTLASWAGAALVIAGSVGFSVWGAKQGLGGKLDRAGSAAAAAATRKIKFGKDPLFAKEMMWFARDRSAIVQAILIPMTMAAVQLFNLRILLSELGGSWNYFCAAAILFGTYFLITLGPKSLASEGSALWIALTWPCGLENLLKAKARIWAGLASVVVAAALCYAVWLFPASGWKIGLVGLGWLVFARSLAEKSVTLVTVTSESGETEKIPAGRRWAVQLGTLTFFIGVATRQWTLAVTGVVYSVMTAAGMWQNFRARLPYLYDPWSEKMPQAPSLMHAMIAISALVEICAVISGAAVYFLGRDNLAVAQTVGYGAGAVIVSLLMAEFLRKRGVSQSEIWLWRQANSAQSGGKGMLLSLAVGVSLGLALGLLALGYLKLLHQFPLTAEILDEASRKQAAIPHLKGALLVLGVLFAPVAEEYLFRGMLYRALDREWGGWLAVAGSAVFFAIYHPPLAWAPVVLVGLCNALLFKRTGRLAPAVALHMVYNATVLS